MTNTHTAQCTETHFLGRCPKCDAKAVAQMSQGQVENWYHQGVIGQTMWEAYMYVWSTSTVRFSSLGDNWQDAPTDPEVIEAVTAIRSNLSK